MPTANSRVLQTCVWLLCMSSRHVTDDISTFSFFENIIPQPKKKQPYLTITYTNALRLSEALSKPYSPRYCKASPCDACHPHIHRPSTLKSLPAPPPPPCLVVRVRRRCLNHETEIHICAFVCATCVLPFLFI